MFSLLKQDDDVRETVYLELWIKGEEEGLSCAIKAIADFKGLRRQSTKHLGGKKKDDQKKKKKRSALRLLSNMLHGFCCAELKSAYLAVAVLNDHEHWGILTLHGSVECLNAHAVLRGAKCQRPWVPNCPWWEIPGKLHAIVKDGGGKKKKGEGNETQKGHSHRRSITSAVTF